MILLISAGALALALVAQHVFGFEPCPWCIAQRVAYAWTAVWAAVALLARARWPLTGSLAGALAAGAMAVHQHWVAAPAGSCALTLPDRLIAASGLNELAPWFFAVTAACDEADRPVLGVAFSLWSLIAAVLLAALCIAGLRAGRKRQPGRPH